MRQKERELASGRCVTFTHWPEPIAGLLRALGLVDVGKEVGCLVGTNVFNTETKEKFCILQNPMFNQSESS